jgi:hypothetical protein
VCIPICNWILFQQVFVMSINVAKTKDFNLLCQEIYLLERPSRANYVVGKAWRQERYWNKECAQGRADGRFWILVTALSEGLNAQNLDLVRKLMKCKNSAKNPAKNIRCLPHSRGNLTIVRCPPTILRKFHQLFTELMVMVWSCRWVFFCCKLVTWKGTYTVIIAYESSASSLLRAL